eukprot:Opistho-2@86424
MDGNDGHSGSDHHHHHHHHHQGVASGHAVVHHATGDSEFARMFDAPETPARPSQQHGSAADHVVVGGQLDQSAFGQDQLENRIKATFAEIVSAIKSQFEVVSQRFSLLERAVVDLQRDVIAIGNAKPGSPAPVITTQPLQTSIPTRRPNSFLDGPIVFSQDVVVSGTPDRPSLGGFLTPPDKFALKKIDKLVPNSTVLHSRVNEIVHAIKEEIRRNIDPLLVGSPTKKALELVLARHSEIEALARTFNIDDMEVLTKHIHTRVMFYLKNEKRRRKTSAQANPGKMSGGYDSEDEGEGLHLDGSATDEAFSHQVQKGWVVEDTLDEDVGDKQNGKRPGDSQGLTPSKRQKLSQVNSEV